MLLDVLRVMQRKQKAITEPDLVGANRYPARASWHGSNPHGAGGAAQVQLGDATLVIAIVEEPELRERLESRALLVRIQ
jgi:hypothetical protein